MSNIVVENRDIVIPGDLLAEGMDYIPGDFTFREDEKIFSKVLGMVSISGRVLKVTALSGPYAPKVGDKIIAKVTDVLMSGWRVDTNTAYSAVLNVRDATARFVRKGEDLTNLLEIGDFIVCKISNVTSQNLIDITMKEPGLKKVEGGRIMKINCNKVPRVIGKQASMIQLIKEATGVEITVGQNGLVWLRGTPEGELKAQQTVLMIEQRAHKSGLTDKISKFLGVPKRVIAPAPASVEEEASAEEGSEQ
ncbi:RNA-binding protein [Candidatus Woesearchaeota archaeon CG10_big_fil_rev_8_21_14_0_10_32_24]|nr:MAG: RNA-binding protein [Candidatus Woesearchaeota archaeon CG10_big_fil_rev_8_21_14_0_10_32_24]